MIILVVDTKKKYIEVLAVAGQLQRVTIIENTKIHVTNDRFVVEDDNLEEKHSFPQSSTSIIYK